MRMHVLVYVAVLLANFGLGLRRCCGRPATSHLVHLLVSSIKAFM